MTPRQPVQNNGAPTRFRIPYPAVIFFKSPPCLPWSGVQDPQRIFFFVALLHTHTSLFFFFSADDRHNGCVQVVLNLSESTVTITKKLTLSEIALFHYHSSTFRNMSSNIAKVSLGLARKTARFSYTPLVARSFSFKASDVVIMK